MNLRMAHTLKCSASQARSLRLRWLKCLTILRGQRKQWNQSFKISRREFPRHRLTSSIIYSEKHSTSYSMMVRKSLSLKCWQEQQGMKEKVRENWWEKCYWIKSKRFFEIEECMIDDHFESLVQDRQRLMNVEAESRWKSSRVWVTS